MASDRQSSGHKSSPVGSTTVDLIVGDLGTITVPSDFPRALGLVPGSGVSIELRGDEIRIRPRGLAVDESLDDPVARITPENRHEEISTGPPVGREVF